MTPTLNDDFTDNDEPIKFLQQNQTPYIEQPIDDSDFKPQRRRLLVKEIKGRHDLLRELSKRTGYSMVALNVVLNALIEIFYDAVLEGIPIMIRGWVSLSHHRVKGYEGVNAYKTRMSGSIVRETFGDSQRSIIKLAGNLRELGKGRFKERLEEEEI